MARWTAILLGVLILVPGSVGAQVTWDRLLNAEDEPHNWLTYSGAHSSTRHSLLDQITPSNADDLELKWVFQARSLENFTSTPLVVDGIMYVTQAPNDVVALDAKTGRIFWVFEHVPSRSARPCCGRVNRGVAILGDTLFMATIDAQLVAIDAISGSLIWQTAVGEPEKGYAMTLAPLIVKDKVIVGVAGGELGIRGYIAAYDAATGDEVWRFYTIPGPGEPGHETWEGDAWEHGGAPVWLTGSYDPDTNQTFWGVGNPGPDWNPGQRPGDNLYSDCVVALDADTGELQWYFQFTPNDAYDYDAVQVPVLVDVETETGGTIKAMFWANRNGFFYALDRTTGRFLNGSPFVEVNWAEGLDDSGRPVQTPQPPGAITYPGTSGGTNWYSPSYSPNTGLFYLSAWENYGSINMPSSEPEVISGGAVLSRRETWATHTGRCQAGGSGPWSHQRVDRSHRHRGGDRTRSAYRRGAVEVRDDGRDEQRDHDDSIEPVVHRWSGRVFPRAGCSERRAALEGGARRHDHERSHQLSGGRDAVRRGGGGKCAVRLRVAGSVKAA